MDAPASPPDGARPSAAAAPARRLTVTITPGVVWLAAAVVVGILLLSLLISRALPTLILLVLAIIIGEAIRPLVERLGRRGIPAALAILLIYLVTLAVIGLLLWVILDPLVKEASAFSASLPDYLSKLRETASDLQRQLRAQAGLKNAIDSMTSALTSALQQGVPALLSVPFNVLSGILGIFIDLVVVLTMTIFWLLSTQRLKPFVVGLFPPAQRERTSSVISEVSRAFGGYVRGTLIAMALIGTLTGLGLFILGVPYALLLGLVAGLTELLPYIGPWISGAAAVTVALVAVGPLKGVEVAILFLLIQEIEGNLVQPLVMNRQVHIDPLLVIVAVLIGIDLLGVIGAILAVPLAAGVQVLVVRVVAPTIRARYREDAPAPLAEEAVPAVPSKPTRPSPST